MEKSGRVVEVAFPKFPRESLFSAVAHQLYADEKQHLWVRYIVHFYMVRDCAVS